MNQQYMVAQSYPPSTFDDRILRVSTHDSFEVARTAADLENMGRDNTTVAVCLFHEEAWWKLDRTGMPRERLIKPEAPEFVDRCLCGYFVTQAELDEGDCPECGRTLSDLSSVWSDIEGRAELS
jgi:hypothetical protein